MAMNSFLYASMLQNKCTNRLCSTGLLGLGQSYEMSQSKRGNHGESRLYIFWVNCIWRGMTGPQAKFIAFSPHINIDI